MADQAPMEENKLTIYPCTINEEGKVTEEISSEDRYTFTLNPASYREYKVIRYIHRKILGGLEDDPGFKRIETKKLDFQVIIDGTGVVPDPKNQDFDTQLRRLNNVVYNYKGNKHEPNHVFVFWGALKFYGRLESMKIDYTLFDPEGKPLRAQVALSFISFLTPREASLKKNQSSPDMSHLITVKAGDTLWQLCHRIYGEAGYYQQVARINDITNFRYLKPGTMLHFPPVR